MGCTKLEKFYVCLGPLAALDPVVIVRLWVKPLPSVRARHVEECALSMGVEPMPDFLVGWLSGCSLLFLLLRQRSRSSKEKGQKSTGSVHGMCLACEDHRKKERLPIEGGTVIFAPVALHTTNQRRNPQAALFSFVAYLFEHIYALLLGRLH